MLLFLESNMQTYINSILAYSDSHKVIIIQADMMVVQNAIRISLFLCTFHSVTATTFQEYTQLSNILISKWVPETTVSR
jgi:hypothetical protein